MKAEREEWIKNQGNMEVKRLVFLDEFAVNTGMTKLYGRAKPGERIVEYVPDVRYERTTVLSSMRFDGECVPVTFSGAVNGNIFKTYIEKFLAPTLRQGDIVIMDSLSSHKVDGINEIVRNRPLAKSKFKVKITNSGNEIEPQSKAFSSAAIAFA